MSRVATAETASYRGYTLIICQHDIMAVAPNGDIACFYSMASVRAWVKRHRRNN